MCFCLHLLSSSHSTIQTTKLHIHPSSIVMVSILSSYQAFINNFQEAKEALAEVTVQAAEKAASGVKELAERSTRIALNVHFNAPVIFLPQSSSSSNVIVADLGLLSVKNCFVKQPCKSSAKIPPVVDKMAVKLTDLKMYRWESSPLKKPGSTCCSVSKQFKMTLNKILSSLVCCFRTTYINSDFQGETQLLKPVSLDLEIQRNLSSNWYHSIPDIEITAHLKPMSVSSVMWLQEEEWLIYLVWLYFFVLFFFHYKLWLSFIYEIIRYPPFCIFLKFEFILIFYAHILFISDTWNRSDTS